MNIQILYFEHLFKVWGMLCSIKMYMVHNFKKCLENLVLTVMFFSLPSLDNTLVAGATGADVVDAALLKIDAVTGLRNDFGFLKRIALVESSFGATTGQNLEGIWQVY